eukprot:NODE_103_length_20051_cov_0.229401.p2 type:complete len:654 gc:universal NODE_103_length_20051_cov_0.229401:2953-4914(+)
MLDYKHHLRSASDLSALWFKEFYLELSKEVQFPIECSLPWILMSFMLNHPSPEYTEFLWVPFSIYNDAAHEALYNLNLSYLFDEVEAEANLVFDQLIFKYSEMVFSHFKTRSSRMLIEQEIEILDKQKQQSANKRSLDQADLKAFHSLHESILKQNRFYLLGRFIDIRRVMGQCMNQYFRKALEVAINRYESSDLTFAVQLGFLIRSNRLAHRLASEILPIDSFDNMLKEVDESTVLGSMGGRLLSHTFAEIVNDIMPNYCFSTVTERFVKSIMTKNKQRPSAKAPVIYLFGTKALNLYVNKQFAGYKGFVGGSPHFAAISKIIGKRQTISLITEIGNVIVQIMESHITPYMKILIKGFPQIKLPSVEYKTQGVYQFFISALAPLLKYQDLPLVMSAFKEIGNGIICCKLLEECLVLFLTKSVDSVLKGLVNFDKIDSKKLSFGNEISMSPKDIDDIAISSLKGAKDLNLSAKRLSILTSKQKLSVLPTIYIKIKDAIEKTTLECSPLLIKTAGMTKFDVPNDFAHIWCFIEFVYALPAIGQTMAHRQISGDGVVWAGCTLMKLLGYSEKHAICSFLTHLSYTRSIEIHKDEISQLPDETEGIVSMSNYVKNINDEIYRFLDLNIAEPEIKGNVYALPEKRNFDQGVDKVNKY